MISWLPGSPADLEKKENQFQLDVLGESLTLILMAGRYRGGRLAIESYELSGEPWGVLTVNLPEARDLAADEIIVKTWSENEIWVPQLLTVLPHVFEDTGRRIPAGYTQAQVWKLKVPIQGEEGK